MVAAVGSTAYGQRFFVTTDIEQEPGSAEPDGGWFWGDGKKQNFTVGHKAAFTAGHLTVGWYHLWAAALSYC